MRLQFGKVYAVVYSTHLWNGAQYPCVYINGVKVKYLAPAPVWEGIRCTLYSMHLVTVHTYGIDIYLSIGPIYVYTYSNVRKARIGGSDS